MSEAKFTKGEWSILPIEDDKEYIRIRGTVLGGRYKIANVSELKNHHSNAAWCKAERIETAANAHLIAAAPKMYEMLSDFLSMDSLDVKLLLENSSCVSDLLAKARGEK